jgi:hypothetical protein
MHDVRSNSGFALDLTEMRDAVLHVHDGTSEFLWIVVLTGITRLGSGDVVTF